MDIDFTRGIVYVDGAALDEPYINEPTHLQFDSRGVTFPLTVEEAMCSSWETTEQFLRQPAGVHWPGGYPVYSGEGAFVMMPGYDKVKDTRDFGRIGGVS